MANNLMICSNGCKALHLNESENPAQRYILEGTFAELDKLNRNQRIYTKGEYLKHLAYLRNDIKSGEPLLGELDHPDDRFEVKLKEASHRVIDLWYDESDNTVKGKIELLDTPNGKLAKSIVDQGIPLHISNRAAGTVNQDNTVSIQQIYTYDLVCKPGFAGAVLHRVNESADAPVYSDDVKNFLSASYKAESMNAAPQYGFVNEDMSVSEIKANAVLRNEAKDIQINKQIEINVEEMSKPLLENTNPDATVGKPLDISGNGAAALGIPTANDLEKKESDDDKEEDKKKEDVSDAPAAEDKPAENKSDDKKLNSNDEKKNEDETSEDDSSESDDKKDDKSTEHLNDDEDEPDEEHKETDDNDEKKEDSDDEGDGESKKDSEGDGVKIIEVEAEFEDDEKKDDDMIKDVEPSFDDDEEEEEAADKEEGEPESDTEDTKDEAAERTVEVGDDDDNKDDAEEEKKAKEAEKLSDKASDDIEKRKDSIMDKLDKLMDAIEKKNSSKEESKNESIIMAKYPISMRMNESNFKEFAKLDESQKNKVVAYLHDNGIADAQSINESWKNGINYVNEIPVWLKYAPENYKALYEAASPAVKESINTTAKYILFESQYDINVFWENSGLQEAEERRLVNESFVNNLPKVAPQTVETNLPYSSDFIKMVTEQACEYSKKY